LLFVNGSLAGREDSQERVHIKDTAAARSSADFLERSPQARLCRQCAIGRKIRPGSPFRQHSSALLGAEAPPGFSHQIH
jgi:hypothetical protein